MSHASGASPRRGKQTSADKNFSLTTTATTADQDVGNSTPTNGKKYVVQAILIEVTFTTPSTTEVHLGTITVRWGTTAILGPIQATNPSSAAPFGFIIAIPDTKVLVGDGSTKINAICTPAAVTSTIWKVTVIGFEEPF